MPDCAREVSKPEQTARKTSPACTYYRGVLYDETEGYAGNENIILSRGFLHVFSNMNELSTSLKQRVNGS